MNSQDNVVSIFEARKQKTASASPHVSATSPSVDADGFLESIMKKDKESKEKAQQDRLKSNKSVLRSYRIKDK